MKFTDDYRAKLKIWAKEPRVYPIPKVINFPKFTCKRFSSYAEMNAWKKSMIDELLKDGGAKWST